MGSLSTPDIIKAFNFYRNSVFSISNDLIFWKSTLNQIISEFESDSNFRFSFIFESGFAVYDLPHDNPNGLLKMYKDRFKVTPDELLEYRNNFFNWIMNLSLLKAYNSCELLLLRSIQLSYFPTLDDPLKNRKSVEKLNFQIKSSLAKADSNNNRHIIEFLKNNSSKFAAFSNQLIRIDFKTTWGNFFELISILRNVIAHNSSLINIDTYNQIKSIGKDIFEFHFELKDDEDGNKILIPKAGDYFLNFVNLINDFALNTSKFIFSENDLSFLDMS